VTEGELQAALLILAADNQHLLRRRTLCIVQWAVDDCGVYPVQTDRTPPEYQTDILGVWFNREMTGHQRYREAVRGALACWRYARDDHSEERGQVLGLGILGELAAMTENETDEPNAERWVAPPLNSRAVAHVGVLYHCPLPGPPDEPDEDPPSSSHWGFWCDSGSLRREFSDRVRGGLLLCPCCLAKASGYLSDQHSRLYESAKRLLQQVGWCVGDSPPVIWRIAESEASWRHIYRRLHRVRLV
jgi:hypothetical protein